ncbi:MAG: dockerin type I domain-containing protein [Armatimonadota bacterium]
MLTRSVKCVLTQIALLASVPCFGFTPTKVKISSPKLIPDGVLVTATVDVTGRLDAGDLSVGRVTAELVDCDPHYPDLLGRASTPVAGTPGASVSLRFEMRIETRGGRVAGIESSYQPSAELAVRFLPSGDLYSDGFDAEAGIPGAPLIVSAAQAAGSGPFVDPGPPLTGTAGSPVLLDARDSVAPGASFTAMLVDWGDGCFYSESTALAPDGAFDLRTPHIYRNPGTYQARVIGISSRGGFDVAFLSAVIAQAPEAVVSIQPAHTRPGKPVVLDVIAETQIEVAAFGATLTFDHSDPPGAPLMTLSGSVQFGDLLRGALTAVNSDTPGQIHVSAVMVNGRLGSGLLIRVPLAVPQSIVSGIVYPVQLDVLISDGEGRRVPVLAKGAAVTVKAQPRKGDLNEDGFVTVDDARRALKIVTGAGSATADELEAADMDNSGSVSISDVVMILRVSVGLAP